MAKRQKGLLAGGGLAAGALLAVAVAAAYGRVVSAPFVFDDGPAIVNNATIRRLWPLWAALAPPTAQGATVGGRPVLNVSLAVNYAISGLRVWSYHGVNLLIHGLAGLTLFGILRRTWDRAVPAAESGSAWRSAAPALGVALLWTLHPLQTESVSYIVQRAESLMGLFYLLTLYCFIRGLEGAMWLGVSVVVCLLGMATKEVMVSAPVMVLLYDRTFVAGTFREAWRRRRLYYLGLAGTWLVLAGLVWGAGSRGGSAGFGTPIPWWRYALTQFHAIFTYLRLSLWPHPLVFSYGNVLEGPSLKLFLEGSLVAILVVTTGLALLLPPQAFGRRPASLGLIRAAGFGGAWFFLILAPSSSVVPIAAETMAEHRMYLSLAAPMAGIVWLVLRLFPPAAAAAACLALAAGLGLVTARRNDTYRTTEALWSDTVAKMPGNAIARESLGVELARAGRLPEAIAQYEQAVALKPDFYAAHYSLGGALARTGRLSAAAAHYEEAVRLRPDDAAAHAQLGLTLAGMGHEEEAIFQCRQALTLNPAHAEAHFGLGAALALAGHLSDAITEFEHALRLKPDYPECRYNLGVALAQQGRLPEARAELEEAIRLRPDYRQAEQALDAVKRTAAADGFWITPAKPLP